MDEIVNPQINEEEKPLTGSALSKNALRIFARYYFLGEGGINKDYGFYESF